MVRLRRVQEVLNEVAFLSVLCAREVLQCLGACVEDDNCFIVTEYFPQGSIFDILHGKNAECTPLYIYRIFFFHISIYILICSFTFLFYDSHAAALGHPDGLVDGPGHRAWTGLPARDERGAQGHQVAKRARTNRPRHNIALPFFADTRAAEAESSCADRCERPRPRLRRYARI